VNKLLIENMVKAKTSSKMNVHKDAATKSVDALLASGKSDVEKIEASIAELYPFLYELTKVEDVFEKELSNDLRGANSALAKSIPIYRNTISQGIANILTLERWLTLHIPVMEDGNNFGVSIQMTVNESMKKKREAWAKRLEDIPTYYSTRAEAVDKLGLPKSTKSETKTQTTTESKGGKDGDESKSNTTVVCEEKNDAGWLQSNYFRMKHLVSIDVQFYASSYISMIDFLNDYISILDAVEKNKEKLTSPKGSNDTRYGGWN